MPRYIVRRVFICSSEGSVVVLFIVFDTLQGLTISNGSQGFLGLGMDSVLEAESIADLMNKRRIIYAEDGY